MHVIGSVRSDVLGRRLLDDESVNSAVDLDVVFDVRSNLLAVLEPLHLLTVLRQFTLKADVDADLVQLHVLQFSREPDLFHCNSTRTIAQPAVWRSGTTALVVSKKLSYVEPG